MSCHFFVKFLLFVAVARPVFGAEDMPCLREVVESSGHEILALLCQPDAEIVELIGAIVKEQGTEGSLYRLLSTAAAGELSVEQRRQSIGPLQGLATNPTLPEDIRHDALGKLVSILSDPRDLASSEKAGQALSCIALSPSTPESIRESALAAVKEVVEQPNKDELVEEILSALLYFLESPFLSETLCIVSWSPHAPTKNRTLATTTFRWLLESNETTAEQKAPLEKLKSSESVLDCVRSAAGLDIEIHRSAPPIRTYSEFKNHFFDSQSLFLKALEDSLNTEIQKVAQEVAARIDGSMRLSEPHKLQERFEALKKIVTLLQREEAPYFPEFTEDRLRPVKDEIAALANRLQQLIEEDLSSRPSQSSCASFEILREMLVYTKEQCAQDKDFDDFLPLGIHIVERISAVFQHERRHFFSRMCAPLLQEIAESKEYPHPMRQKAAEAFIEYMMDWYSPPSPRLREVAKNIALSFLGDSARPIALTGLNLWKAICVGAVPQAVMEDAFCYLYSLRSPLLEESINCLFKEIMDNGSTAQMREEARMKLGMQKVTQGLAASAVPRTVRSVKVDLAMPMTTYYGLPIA